MKFYRYLERLNKISSNIENICWSSLVDMGLEEDSETRLEYRDSAKDTRNCILESKTGSCYCGKFEDGKLTNRTETNLSMKEG